LAALIGDCDGQVKRVAARFGLIAAAGEIATALEILPWPKAEATRAVRECFAAWVDVRGGIEAAEEREGVTAVRAFLSAHALSRFLPAWESDDPAAAKIINLAGYRRRASADMDAWDFYITADAWTEVAAGFNKKALAETLAKNGFLEVPEKRASRQNGSCSRHSQRNAPISRLAPDIWRRRWLTSKPRWRMRALQ
jgi:putative DNA primase/helicase